MAAPPFPELSSMQPGHPLLAKRRDHDGRAAVLEAAGRREPFELEVRPAASPWMLHERRTALAHRHRFGDLDGEGCGISPKRAHSRADVAASDAGQRRDHQRPTLVGAPARLGKRVGPTGVRIYVGGRSWGGFGFHFEIHGRSLYRTGRPLSRFDNASGRSCAAEGWKAI